MKYVLAGCALALCTGSVALASDQLARQLGVEPGVYTDAQLAVIKTAQEEDDALTLNRAMARTDVVVSTQSIRDSGRMSEQLARQLRVEPGVYTDAQLALIKTVQEEDDALMLKWAMAQNDVVISTQSIGGSGRMNEQLARTVGADPADNSVAELSYMFFDLYAD